MLREGSEQVSDSIRGSSEQVGSSSRGTVVRRRINELLRL